MNITLSSQASALDLLRSALSLVMLHQTEKHAWDCVHLSW